MSFKGVVTTYLAECKKHQRTGYHLVLGSGTLR
jgi:hypothetical protein